MLPINCAETRNPKQLKYALYLALYILLSGSGEVSGQLIYSPSSIDFGEVKVGETSAQRIVTLSEVDLNSELSTQVANIDFGWMKVNTKSQAFTVPVANTYHTPLDITDINTATPFEQTNDCPISLDTGDACTIQVTFSPQASGMQTGQLSITANANTYSVTLSGLGAPTVEYIANLLLPYVGKDASAISTSKAIAQACLSDKIGQHLQEDCSALISALQQGATNISSALLKITPKSATKANAIVKLGGVTQIRNLESRIKGLREGVRGLSFHGLDLRLYNKKLPLGKLTQAYRKQLTQRHTAHANRARVASRLGIFFTGDITTGKKSKTDFEPGFDFSTHGITLGADYRFTERFILGGALGYIDTNTTLKNKIGDLDTQGYSLSLYGTYYAKKRFFLDFASSYGSNHFRQHRRIQYEFTGITTVDQDLTADYKGNMFNLFLGSGYDLKNNLWTFGPRMDLEYIKSYVDGFNEQASNPTAAGSGWTAQVDATEQHWLTLNLGGNLSYTHAMRWGDLVPYSRLDWLHEFKDDAQINNTHFYHDPIGNIIQIETNNPDRNYLRLRVGTTAKFNKGVVAYIDYGTLLAHSSWSSRTVNLGFRMKL
jgi:outer membrane autotransporter protein